MVGSSFFFDLPGRRPTGSSAALAPFLQIIGGRGPGEPSTLRVQLQRFVELTFFVPRGVAHLVQTSHQGNGLPRIRVLNFKTLGQVAFDAFSFPLQQTISDR